MKNNKWNFKLLALFIAIFALVSTDVYAQRPGRGRNNAGWCDGYGPGRGYGNGYGSGYGNGGRGRGMGYAAYTDIPSITENQLKEIEGLRTTHIKKAQSLRAKLQVEQAHLNSLRVEGSDEKTINASIDKLTSLRGDLIKEREAHRRQIRALLTDEQKVWFDARPNCRYFRNAGGDSYYGRGMRGGWQNQPYRDDVDIED
ncbi:MAG: Spy/CpxP family protein refolding chaperone [Lentimicrobiaceae bacterium]|nr:Spy/CpxP family protein refolding chaperone [Lentimicrobiaceae bacterium]